MAHILRVFCSIFLLINYCASLPTDLIPELKESNLNHTSEITNPFEPKETDTVKDLYVIRKVVYEIGILTDADNSTDYENKTHEQVDLSFFDPLDNGTFIDLSNIPIPIETNISAVALTGIFPANLGGFTVPNNNGSKNFPLYPDKQIKITKNISSTNKTQTENILSNISDVLGLSQLVN